MKTLYQFKMELFNLGFDKRKVQGLVKRANTAGFNIYYAYHEDGADTWRRGWSSDDYKRDYNDVTLFESTTLIGKTKGGGSFRRGQSYTAECAIFVFCPIETLMKDEVLRERKLEAIRQRAITYAAADHARAIELKQAIKVWQELPVENKAEIAKLQAEISEIYGEVGSRKIRQEKEKMIDQLGGRCPILADWQIAALSFGSLEAFTEFRKEDSVSSFLDKIKDDE